MQAMMYRARQLDIISVNQFQYLMRQVSAKGWRLREPGDTPCKLHDTILQGAIEALLDSGYSVERIVDAFNVAGIYLNQRDMEELMGLRTGTLNQGKIIPFRPIIEVKS